MTVFASDLDRDRRMTEVTWVPIPRIDLASMEGPTERRARRAAARRPRHGLDRCRAQDAVVLPCVSREHESVRPRNDDMPIGRERRRQPRSDLHGRACPREAHLATIYIPPFAPVLANGAPRLDVFGTLLTLGSLNCELTPGSTSDRLGSASRSKQHARTHNHGTSGPTAGRPPWLDHSARPVSVSADERAWLRHAAGRASAYV